MSTTTESPYSVTFKTDQTYEAAMVTVRADTAEELAARLQALTEVGQSIADTKILVAALQAAEPLVNAAPAAQPAPAEAATGTVTELRTCAHGKRVFKSGNRKDGSQWTAWMCALPANATGKCEPQWVK